MPPVEGPCGAARFGDDRGDTQDVGQTMTTTVVRYLGVEDVQALTGWSKAYVHKRASVDRWRRLNSRPPKYRMADVLDSAKGHKDTRVIEHLRNKHA